MSELSSEVFVELLEIDIVIYVVVKDVICGSFLFEKVAILLHMLLIGVNTDKATSSFKLKQTFLNHRIVCPFSLVLRDYWKWAQRTVLPNTFTAYAVELLLIDLRQESFFKDSALLVH